MIASDVELLQSSPSGVCLKYVMIIHQVIMTVIGVICLGIGIWLATWTHTINHLSFLMDYDYYRAGYVLLIIIGIVLLIVSIVGCCGSQQENACMILSSLIVNIVCFCTFVAICILGFQFAHEIRNTMKARLSLVITKGYGVNSHDGYYNNITYSIDVLQKEYKCCGAYGDLNSTSSWYIYRSASAWYRVNSKGADVAPYVPKTCCVLKSDGNIKDEDVCVGRKAAETANSPPIKKIPVKGSNTNLHQNGCYDQMLNYLLYYSNMIGAVGATFFVYLFIGIVCSFALLRVLAVAKFDFDHLTPEEKAQQFKVNNNPTFGRPANQRPDAGGRRQIPGSRANVMSARSATATVQPT